MVPETPFQKSFIYCWLEANVNGIKVGHGSNPESRAADYANAHGFIVAPGSIRQVAVLSDIAFTTEQFVHSRMEVSGFRRFGKYELFLPPQGQTFEQAALTVLGFAIETVEEMFRWQRASMSETATLVQKSTASSPGTTEDVLLQAYRRNAVLRGGQF